MSGYVPIEYPKWLRGDAQPDTLVQDAAEERRVLATWRKAAASAAAAPPAQPDAPPDPVADPAQPATPQPAPPVT